MKAPRTGHGRHNFFTVTFPEYTAGLSIIASLVLIEGLLSVDNVLGIAAIARSLPEVQRKRAIRLGMAGAYLFRVIALIFVGVLKDNLWVRWLGAGYTILLLVLVYARFTRMQKLMAPVNVGALPVMKLFAGTVGLPFKLINWLITKGRHRLAKKTYEATHPGN